ncbi:hypothetical protein GGS24DRAFT_338246 [Hypoxylon argillaceum]|nr:hypothetical protein GGS24DRAFT_338246 [Hypoxylon argillaceum]
MNDHKQRTDTILNLLNTCRESRATVLRRWCFVPVRDLLITQPSIMYPELDSLDHQMRVSKLAINWRKDTVVWNENCPFPLTTLPWVKHLCNATKLCIIINDFEIFDKQCEGLPSGDMDDQITHWARSILPVLTSLEEVTFGITHGLDRDEPELWEPPLGTLSPEECELLQYLPGFFWSEEDEEDHIETVTRLLNLYKTKPWACHIAQDGDDDGYNHGPWWRSVLGDGSTAVTIFQRVIKQVRPMTKFSMILDAASIDEAMYTLNKCEVN